MINLLVEHFSKKDLLTAMHSDIAIVDPDPTYTRFISAIFPIKDLHHRQTAVRHVRKKIIQIEQIESLLPVQLFELRHNIWHADGSLHIL